MEGFSPAWAWAVIGLLLALSELLTGAFVLLALGIGALITSLAVAVFDMSLTGQLLVMGSPAGLILGMANTHHGHRCRNGKAISGRDNDLRQRHQRDQGQRGSLSHPGRGRRRQSI